MVATLSAKVAGPAVVDEKLAATPPMVSVVVVIAPAPAAAAWRTHTDCPLAIVPAAAVKVAVQPTEYSPPVTVTAAAAVIPVIVAGSETTVLPAATPVFGAKEKGSGVVSPTSVNENALMENEAPTARSMRRALSPLRKVTGIATEAPGVAGSVTFAATVALLSLRRKLSPTGADPVKTIS